MQVNQRGDTIVEVLFAITVFSLVAVGALAIMNLGSNLAQRSLEVTQVRQQIDAQAELIRFAHAAYASSPNSNSAAVKTWRDIKAKSVTSIVSNKHVDKKGKPICPAKVNNSFVLMRRTSGSSQISLQALAKIDQPAVYSQVNVARESGRGVSSGLWVQAARVASKSPGISSDAYDIHIHACWASPGADVPSKLETIVRLYEPKI